MLWYRYIIRKGGFIRPVSAKSEVFVHFSVGRLHLPTLWEVLFRQG